MRSEERKSSLSSQPCLDHYPFGWEIKERSFSTDAYRFGFNGKENDQEYGEQLIQDYGFRLYNPAIAKFLSVDPLAPEYPELTPYQFASNSPIAAIDWDGLEGRRSTSSDRQRVTSIIRNSHTFDIMDLSTSSSLNMISKKSLYGAASIIDQRSSPSSKSLFSSAMGYYGQAIASGVISEYHNNTRHRGTASSGREEFAGTDYVQITFPIRKSNITEYSTVGINPLSNEHERTETRHVGPASRTVLAELYEIKTTTSLVSTANSFIKAVDQLSLSTKLVGKGLGAGKVQAVPYVVLDKEQWSQLYQSYSDYQLGGKPIYYGTKNLSPKLEEAVNKLNSMNGKVIPIENLTQSAQKLTQQMSKIPE